MKVIVFFWLATILYMSSLVLGLWLMFGDLSQPMPKDPASITTANVMAVVLLQVSLGATVVIMSVLKRKFKIFT